jgi:hypothetical protein
VGLGSGCVRSPSSAVVGGLRKRQEREAGERRGFGTSARRPGTCGTGPAQADHVVCEESLHKIKIKVKIKITDLSGGRSEARERIAMTWMTPFSSGSCARNALVGSYERGNFFDVLRFPMAPAPK